MVKILAVVFAVGVALTAFSPAEAREGCGLGRHRGPLGACHVNGDAIIVAPRRGVVVIAPTGRVCPWGWHLGPYGHCRRD